MTHNAEGIMDPIFFMEALPLSRIEGLRIRLVQGLLMVLVILTVFPIVWEIRHCIVMASVRGVLLGGMGIKRKVEALM